MSGPLAKNQDHVTMPEIEGAVSICDRDLWQDEKKNLIIEIISNYSKVLPYKVLLLTCQNSKLPLHNDNQTMAIADKYESN